MAKFGKLTKLKSVIKKWPSFIKNHHSSTVSTTTSATTTEVSKCNDLQLVYVGNCSDHNDDDDDCERGSVEELAEFYTY
ncbi:hypothetical protein HID58_065133 [Brassica napus]|uniref:Uncharacterized protein n=1 Tax=Brassica napus TaxID=3708 RepID=A0ABQ7ZBY7_BRANA|nr:hypothetical protein HID58_065133 [Brassica napus]